MRGPDEGDGVPARMVGEVLAGRFEVRGLLGSGGMAEVFEVFDRPTNRELALKVLRPQVAHLPEAAERMRREAAVLASIDHAAIVSAEDFGTLEDGRVYFAMERLRGETLGARMRRGPMTPAELVPVLTGLATGLEAAHGRGVLHRDLKPDNVFLTHPTGADAPSIKILDFGVSKVLDYERLTQTGQILGTPRYMAPEQLTADQDLDARVDVYAVGVILYEALAGQPPFVASDPAELIVSVLHGQVVPLRALRVDLRPELEAVVMGAMHPDREHRPASVGRLAQAFAEHAAAADAPVVPPGVPTSVMGTMDPRALPRAEAPPWGQGPSGAEGAARARQGPSAEDTSEPVVADPADDGPEDLDSLMPAGLSSRRGPALVGASAGILVAIVALWVTDGFGWFPTAGPPGDAQGSGAAEPGTPEADETLASAPPLDDLPPRDPEVPDGGNPPAPEPAAAPDESSPTPPAPSAEPRRRRSPPSKATGSAEVAPTPPADTNTPATTANEALRKARRAHAAGDGRGCVDHVERAMELGAPAPVLRLLGDCHWMEGSRAMALDAYRRFCRLVPDHPALPEVRRRVESAGARCP